MRIIFIILLLVGCQTEEIQPVPELYWETRHDAIPEQFKGYWSSVTDKTETVLIVTDSYVMTEHFTIDREQDNVVKVNDSVLHMYKNGKFYALAFGNSGTLTITADNYCYDTVVPFQQQQTNLN